MAIGDIRLGDTTRATSQARVNPNAFGAGIARAISGLAGATGNYEESRRLLAEATQGRTDSIENADVAAQFIAYQGASERAHALRLRNTEGPAVGVTNQTHDEITSANTAWLDNVPERLRNQYTAKLATLAQNQITGAFNYEYQQGNAFFGQLTIDTTNELASQMQTGDIGADDAMGTIVDLLEQSDIPDLAKQEFLSTANTMFMSVEFAKEIAIGLAGGGAVNDGTTGDIAMAGAQPAQRGILNAIASPESGGDYNARYSVAGGATFEGFADHPRVYEEVPRDLNHYTQAELDAVNASTMRPKKSSAAGRYQFTAQTWDDAVKALGLTDFSPANQDRAALWLAGTRYNRGLENGDLTFDQMINSGDRDKIIEVKNALDSTWIGLRGMSDDQFANILLGAQGVAGGGTGNAVSPDLWNDPRYGGLSYVDKLGLAQDAATALASQQTSQAAFLADQLASTRNDAYLGAALGEYTSSDRDLDMENGVFETADQLTKINKHLTDYTNRVQSASDTQTRLADESAIFQPAADGANLDAYIGQEGLDAVASMDSSYVNNRLLPTMDRTGFIPPAMANQLSAMASGTNPKQREFALGVLADMYDSNPKSLDFTNNISKDLMADVVLFSGGRKNAGSTSDVISQLEFVNDPANAQMIKDRTKDALETFNESITADNLLEAFDPGFLARIPFGVQMPTMPLSGDQSDLLRSEMRDLYVQGFTRTGDSKQATDFMNEQIQRNWGRTEVGGVSRVSRNGMETMYAQFAGSYDYLTLSIRDELGLANDVIFQPFSDEQTLAERDAQRNGAAGARNPSVQLVKLDEKGEWQHMVDENNVAIRVNVELNEQMLSDQRERDGLINLQAKIANETQVLVDEHAQVNMQSGPSFGGGGVGQFLGGEGATSAPPPTPRATDAANSLVRLQSDLTERLDQTSGLKYADIPLAELEKTAAGLWEILYGPTPTFNSLSGGLFEVGKADYKQLLDRIKQLGGVIPEGAN